VAYESEMLGRCVVTCLVTVHIDNRANRTGVVD
jgi:hypothetical protein